MRLPVGYAGRRDRVTRRVERTFTIVPEERESAEALVHELPALGITASNLTAWSAKELRRPDRTACA